MNARTEVVAKMLSILAAFHAAHPTLLVRSFKVRPPSLVTDTPCAYIDLRPFTVHYDSSMRDLVLSPSIVFVDRLTDNGETMDRFDTLIDTFTEFLDAYPYLAVGNAVWSNGTWTDEAENLGRPDGQEAPAAAARFTFNDALYKSGRTTAAGSGLIAFVNPPTATPQALVNAIVAAGLPGTYPNPLTATPEQIVNALVAAGYIVGVLVAATSTTELICVALLAAGLMETS
jgi:hypothetical protein